MWAQWGAEEARFEADMEREERAARPRRRGADDSDDDGFDDAEFEDCGPVVAPDSESEGEQQPAKKSGWQKANEDNRAFDAKQLSLIHI